MNILESSSIQTPGLQSPARVSKCTKGLTHGENPHHSSIHLNFFSFTQRYFFLLLSLSHHSCMLNTLSSERADSNSPRGWRSEAPNTEKAMNPRSSDTAATHSAPPESKLDGIEVSNRTPHFSNQAFLGHVDVAQVQGVVNRLHLAHFDEPHTDVFSSCLQNPLAMILSLVQHLSEKQEKDEDELKVHQQDKPFPQRMNDQAAPPSQAQVAPRLQSVLDPHIN